MSIDRLQQRVPDFAKDIRLNLGTIFNNAGANGLSPIQLYGSALAVAYTLESDELIQAILESGEAILSSEIINAAKVAASIMAMNNVYYRAIHLAENKELSRMPAQLRMNALVNLSIPSTDFELFCLAVSVINGCGKCIQSHTQQLLKNNVSLIIIQTILRLSAILNAVKLSLIIAKT